MKVAVCEMTSTDELKKNKELFLLLLGKAIAKGAEFISFPENALYLRIQMDQKGFVFSKEDDVFTVVSQICKKNKVTVHIGSVSLRKDNKRNNKLKSYNSTVMINANGEVSFPYDKIHLFDIELDGQSGIKESDEYYPGEEPFIYKLKGLSGESFKVGLSICYDLRFSDLYSYYAKNEVDIIVVPSAFLITTGKAHWHMLLRARAIECQSYVLAAAQSGLHKSVESGNCRQTYGHSLIVGPWGEILEENVETKEVGGGLFGNIIYSNIESGTIQKVRSQIPVNKHRKKLV